MYVSYNILIYINQITSTYFLILVRSSVSITARKQFQIDVNHYKDLKLVFWSICLSFNQQVAS